MQNDTMVIPSSLYQIPLWGPLVCVSVAWFVGFARNLYPENSGYWVVIMWILDWGKEGAPGLDGSKPFASFE